MMDILQFDGFDWEISGVLVAVVASDRKFVI